MRKRRRGQRATRKRIFVALLLCSVVGLALPSRISGRLMNLFQVVVPFQFAATHAAEALDIDTGPTLAPAEIARLTGENNALEHTVASLYARVNDLEQRNRELAGIREAGLPGRLIPAHVIAPDALAWRESLLVDKGRLSAVRPDAAVVSNCFAVNLGADDGVRTGQAVLAAEVFVGSVEVAATHTARVRLASDPSTRMTALIARDVGDAYEPLDAEFWLVGAGDNRARIEDVNHRFVGSGEERGGIRVGDYVLTVGDPERLPVSMVIGTVETIRRDDDNPLLYVLDVRLAVNADRLRRVYVVDPIGE